MSCGRIVGNGKSLYVGPFIFKESLKESPLGFGKEQPKCSHNKLKAFTSKSKVVILLLLFNAFL